MVGYDDFEIIVVVVVLFEVGGVVWLGVGFVV